MRRDEMNRRDETKSEKAKTGRNALFCNKLRRRSALRVLSEDQHEFIAVLVRDLDVEAEPVLEREEQFQQFFLRPDVEMDAVAAGHHVFDDAAGLARRRGPVDVCDVLLVVLPAGQGRALGVIAQEVIGNGQQLVSGRDDRLLDSMPGSATTGRPARGANAGAGTGAASGSSSAWASPEVPMINWPMKIPPFSTEIDFAVTLPSRSAFR